MGYFSEKDIIRQDQEESNKIVNITTKEQFINAICAIDLNKEKEDLKGLSLEELKALKRKMDLEQEKAYFKMYGKKAKERLYEYEDEELEEKEGYTR